MTKINLDKQLGEEARYVDTASAEAIEATDLASWKALVLGAEELNGDDSVPGSDCYIAVTKDSLGGWDRVRGEHWRELGERSEFIFDEHPAIKYEGFQMFKGQQRQDIVVIQLNSEHCACLSMTGFVA